MSQRIRLSAIVARDGLLYLLRPEAGGHWDLPGGALGEGADVDEAMDAYLVAHGVQAPAIEEDFVRTVYVGTPPAGMVLNLYAPTEWTGEPVAGAGHEGGWFDLVEIETLDMDGNVRQALLDTFGEEPDDGFAALQELQERLPAELRQDAAPVASPEPFVDRRAAGYDVLRTLNNMPGEQAARQMSDMYGPLAEDVFDYALGTVWALPHIDRKTKSLQVVAMIAAQGHAGPLRSHVNGALNHGVTPEQLAETIRLVAAYAGFPAALEAWRVMEKVVEARGLKIERPL
ncbi:MAG: carboxymuconolactone decarboxylase family protein [Dehalococcoidia bacterium]|nr:carboxymuconolactone decarboxylase family protein [Dehalococcoidia bacterium]